MILYKFRSIQNITFVLDIIKNKRFYASPFRTLNDPMEGIFNYDRRLSKEDKASIVSEKEKRRICSFSKSLSHPLLWAHYADGFKGVCVETKVNKSEHYSISEINYSPYRPFIETNCLPHAIDWADWILSHKNDYWSYEEEVRLLTKNEFIVHGLSINAIYFGLRTSDINKWLIKKLAGNRVKTFDTKISKHTNLIEKIPL